MRLPQAFFTGLLIMILCGLAGARSAYAHPMGNFSINHYARFSVGAERLTLRYVLDMAEIPTVTERSAMDTNRDGNISEAERSVYLAEKIRQLRTGLTLRIHEAKPQMSETLEGMEFRPGAGGLETLRLTFTLQAAFPASVGKECRIRYKDINYAERAGWKEIVATPEEGVTLARSTAATKDLSQELTVYPADPTVFPPQQREAEFTVGRTAGSTPAPKSASNTMTAPALPSAAKGGDPRTPQDGFTQSISRRDLTAGVVLISLALALLFGAFHALSPGHGKAMVAAYLVGSRGTVRHAIFLGGVITLTHTISVFALGLITLIAAQFVVPERLYPALSLGSGIAIVCVGLALLGQRLAAWRGAIWEKRTGRMIGDWSEDESSGPPLPVNAPVSFKSLMILGITGGALPCPSALVVMLGAIALHRIAFGLALICAFSLGLASVLTGIGLLVVRLRGALERLPLHENVTSRLPIFSAALVTLVGVILIFRALHGQF